MSYVPVPYGIKPQFDIGRFNKAAHNFLRRWRPKRMSKSKLGIGPNFDRFSFSHSGKLAAIYHEIDPSIGTITTVWGLDVGAYLNGKLVARQLSSKID